MIGISVGSVFFDKIRLFRFRKNHFQKFCSQPSLSQYIHKIEKDLGVILFERTGTDIRLTDAGQISLTPAEKFWNLNARCSTSFPICRAIVPEAWFWEFHRIAALVFPDANFPFAERVTIKKK